MRVFVAGASGAIGRPLIAELVRNGHTVIGMTQSQTGAKKLTDLGATVEIADAFDQTAVTRALQSAQPDAVIDELTSLPQNPNDMAAYAAGDRRLRLEGGGNLHRAARAVGVHRYIQQASGFFLAPGPGLGDESTPLAIHASPSVAGSATTYTALEERTLTPGPMEGVALRYGFFYGPGTWYNPDGAAADALHNQQMPVIGEGEGVSSWIHIDDAASATVAALTIAPGVYNIVDDDPSPSAVWIPALAKFVGAPPPPHITEEQARAQAGEDAVYYATKLRGASNKKARETFGFNPRRLEWLTK